MRYFQTVDEILDFAISLEEEACRFADFVIDNVGSAHLAELLKQFADQENRHIATLKSIKYKNHPHALQKAVGLKIADFATFSDHEEYGKMSYKDALSVAIKKENACIKLYSKLAMLTVDQNLQSIFLTIAEEEACHRHAFQREYDTSTRKTTV